ncbi:MAG: hypothetical protein J5X22_14795 [Candidatus Accumulibacter sp.]|uniref:hypothetical protein n=1 Tax=Accumulibacter sp. TaxID=2053492 RepID=UPI001B00145F|nr:hypothetical protein [Accumulibacter sp.]MBO3711711.1 hypothetical protein [Accumulibacter sp.]
MRAPAVRAQARRAGRQAGRLEACALEAGKGCVQIAPLLRWLRNDEVTRYANARVLSIRLVPAGQR